MKKYLILIALCATGSALGRGETCISCKFKVQEDETRDYRIIFDLTGIQDKFGKQLSIESTQAAQDEFCQEMLPKGHEMRIPLARGKSGLRHFLSFGTAGNTYDVAEGINEIRKEKKLAKDADVSQYLDTVHVVSARHPSGGSIQCNIANAAQAAMTAAGKIAFKVAGVAVMIIPAIVTGGKISPFLLVKHLK